MARTSRTARAAGRRYTMAEHGTMGRDSGMAGDFMTNKDLVEIRKPRYKGSPPLVVLRLLPQLNPESDEREFDAFRLSTDPRGFGDWIRVYSVAIVGDPPVMFLTHDPVANPDYDIRDNPVSILCAALETAIKRSVERPGWAKLKDGAQNQAAVLKRPSRGPFVMAGLFQDQDKIFDTPLGLRTKDKIFLYNLGPSAGDALLSALNVVKPGMEGVVDSDEDDPADKFEHGDIVSLDKGGFVRIYREDYNPDSDSPQRGAGGRKKLTADAVATSNSGNNRASVIKGYKVDIVPEFNGYSADLSELHDAWLSKVRPWEEMLHFMSDKEQAELLCGRLPGDLIEYAFADHPHLLPDPDSAAYARLHQKKTVPSGFQSEEDDCEEEQEEEEVEERNVSRSARKVKTDESKPAKDTTVRGAVAGKEIKPKAAPLSGLRAKLRKK